MAMLRLAVALLLAASGASQTCTNYTGYLVDLFCWYQPNMIGLDGSKLSMSPQDHLVNCALMPQCKASGFGLLTGNGSMYSLAYVFSAGANSLALTYLTTLAGMQANGTASKNISVAVCGTATGSMLTASSIADVSGQTSVVMSSATTTWPACYSGFLVDLMCWNLPGNVGVDGAPLATAPQNHTVGCLLLSACVASGYGLVTKGSGSTYGLTYTFNKAGNGLVLLYLARIKAAGAMNNVMVSVCGKPDPLDSTKTTVYTITDASGATSVAVSATPETDAAWVLPTTTTPPANTNTSTTTKLSLANGAPARGWAALAGMASAALLARWAAAAA